jgi:cytochrome c-type biogenesis protein CcmF
MNQIQAPIVFNGEWLWLGNLGHAFVILAFVMSILSAVFYFQHEQTKSQSLQIWAKRFFQIHALAIVSVFVVLFSIIFFHRYEFHYAWRHSSNSLPVYYMISCFWEGQEGSFLLWLFWNALIGVILQRVAKSWESPVMVVIAFAQIALSSMLVGFQWGEFKLGSSPFDLLREQRPDFLNIPILGQLGVENYLQVFKDGNGLNALLQNYWMVIHPPTLFLGFATAIVPFAYSIAALWRNNERGWIPYALIWSLVCAGILGLGIIMGGFWAYESLSFGGYWAWDPVENASLMPWLIMASAAHMLIISKSTGRHLFTSHLLTQISFWLVLYATFLTRSGILGEASVHSFTDLGLSGQLLMFLLAFLAFALVVVLEGKKRKWALYGIILALLVPMSLAYMIKSPEAIDTFYQWLKGLGTCLFLVWLVYYIFALYNKTKANMTDERMDSREFWMFLGSMFLILSLVQVFAATSIPVFNKLFGYKTAVPSAADYNRVQLWLAMPIMLLMSFGYWFKFRETDLKTIKKPLIQLVLVSIIITILLMFGFEIYELKFVIFLLLSCTLIIANLVYGYQKKKFEWLRWGGNIAHVGFGVLLMGVLVSSVNKNVLSSTKDGIDLAPEVDQKGNQDTKGIKFNRENQLLYKNKPQELQQYTAIYLEDIKGVGVDSIDKYFKVAFVKKDKEGRTVDSFVLSPKTQNNPKMGLLAEPSTRHFLHKDIFTHVNYESSMDRKEPFSNFRVDTVGFFRPFITQTGKVVMSIDSINRSMDSSGLKVTLAIKAKRLGDSVWLRPEFLINEITGNFDMKPAESDRFGIMAAILNLQIIDPNPASQNIRFVIQTGEKTPVWDYIVIQVIEFPWINLVWAGTIIMVIGFTLAVINRIKKQKQLMA